MGITIKEIASLAGVHRSTVDKVLHKREGVSDEVRKRVQKIIDENNYYANPIGKALKMQNKQLKIGVILLKVDALPYLKAGIKEELEEYKSFQIEVDYREIAYFDVKIETETIRKFREEEYDGIILSPVNAPEIVAEINACQAAGIPVVTVNTDIKGSERFSYIGQDGYKAGKVAARFMGEFLNGKGNVVILTSDGDERQSFPFGTREGGFREIMEKAYPGISILPSIRTNEDPEIMRNEVARVLKSGKKTSGIFITCGSVKEAGEVIEKNNTKGIRLICFEDYPEILELMEKEIVTLTIDSCLNEQGRTALKVLLDKLIYENNPPRKHLYTDISVMVKESV